MDTASQRQVAPSRRAPILGDICGGRDNNLNLIRMVAASSVVVSHSFPMTIGFGAVEPLEPLTGHSLGWLAVIVFFVVSGFLISRSFDRRISGWHWFFARVLRLYPGLLLMLTLTFVVLGPLVTILSPHDYWEMPATWTYLPRNAGLVELQYKLPGVFEDNPYPDAINGSLWTLVNEVACYGGVFIVGIFGALRRPRWFVLCLLVFCLVYVAVLRFHFTFGLPPRIASTVSLGLPFAMGMVAYVWRDRIPLAWRFVPLLWLATVVVHATSLFTPAYILAVGYSVLVLAYRPKGAFLHYNRLGDYSYGIYIYGMPIQQLMVHLFPGQHWLTNILLSYPLALVAAILSWHIVEERALLLVKPTAERWSGFWKREGLGTMPPPDGDSRERI